MIIPVLVAGNKRASSSILGIAFELLKWRCRPGSRRSGIRGQVHFPQDFFMSPSLEPPAPHAGTQSPQPHAVQEYPHSQQDQQSSAPPAKCDASNAPTAATDQSRSPASPDHPPRVDTPHSFPTDRDARCSAPHDFVELHAHGSRVRGRHHWIRRAEHRGVVPPVEAAGLQHAGRCVQAAALKSCRDSVGSLQDDSGIFPKDRLPSRRGRDSSRRPVGSAREIRFDARRGRW